MVADIMTISRLRMGTDGEGVSTLVTFFDCPLRCKYCINDFCHYSGKRLRNDPVRAIYTPNQLIAALKKDEIYYLRSGGGIVFGGGEPLLQSAFIHEVCKLANPKWKKRVETSLNVPWVYIDAVLKDMDEWIIDVTDMNPFIYENYTGGSFDRFYTNLYRLAKKIPPEKLHLRVPEIPGFNTDADIENSVMEIREKFHTEPEVFPYIVPDYTIKGYRSEKYNRKGLELEIPEFLKPVGDYLKKSEK